MENRDWEILRVLYKERNITKTAETLYMTQPAMTKRLQHIEREFGVAIVHRGKRGVHFTPQGEYLAKCADDFLKLFSKVYDNLANMQDKTQGTLRIGASYFITRNKLPEILALFKQKYPDVDFHVTTGWSRDIFNLLYAQEIHVAFVRGEYNWQDQKHLLMEENICVVCANKFEIKDLPRLQRIDYKMDYKLKELISNWWWDNFSEPPAICMEVDKSDTCREIVTRGLGYAILPSRVVDNVQDIYKINISRKDGTPIKRKTWMFYQGDFLELKIVKAFVEFIKNMNF
ncbi:LysR family transcriptional regulator [Sporomusa acidovorans]|uniref:LysR family transcriptional regulator n=1 Tax=Sporomusa acidovorans TaxID=112900 RepID=UPI000B85D391|nr:LysR family transcriptional regulator [Sporomusa acidovorans]